MEKPGTHNMVRGGLWLLFGGALTAGSFIVFQGAGVVMFYGAILVGGLQLLTGVGQRLSYQVKSPGAREMDRAQATVVTLVRAMVLVANADGKLDNDEVLTISSIYRQLVGEEIDPAEVRSIAGKIGDGGGDRSDFIASLGRQLDVESRILVARACYAVARSDGGIGAEEHAVIREVLDGLRLPRDVLARESA